MVGMGVLVISYDVCNERNCSERVFRTWLENSKLHKPLFYVFILFYIIIQTYILNLFLFIAFEWDNTRENGYHG